MRLTFLTLSIYAGLVAADPISDNDDQIQQISSKLTKDMPNITVVLHPPVVVPAMGLPEKPVAPKRAADLSKLGRPLAAVDSEFALINGTPVFFHTTEAPLGESGESVPKSVKEDAAAVAAEIRNDTLTVAHAVLKAVEHFNNVTDHKPELSPTILEAGSTESKPGANSSGTSVSVVVVPLIQNAFDLPDHSSSSAAELAASNPLVISSHEGNHTTLHVVVKRAEPSAKVNFHGPLMDEETESNMTATVAPLPKSKIVVVQQANGDGLHFIASSEDLVTEHADPSQNISQKVDAVPFAKATSSSSVVPSAPLIEPPVLIPMLAPSVQIIPTAVGIPVRESEKATTSSESPDTTFTPPFNFTVVIPTLPTLSAHQVVKLAQPDVTNPLPVGTFQFLSDDKRGEKIVTTADLIHLQ